MNIAQFLAKAAWAPIFALLAATMIGCGGGGTAGSEGPARLAVYATDSLETDYDHVWVKLYRVSLEGRGSVVVFEDPNGFVVDLKSLRDSSGARYAFLEDIGINPGTYPQVRVEADESVVLVPKGTDVAESRLFAQIHAAPGSPGRSELFVRSPSTIVPGRNLLVIDFDLSNWSLDADGRVVAVLSRGSGNGLDDHNRHELHEVSGVVSDLAGTPPNQTFRLSRERGSINVQTSASTRIFQEGATGDPVLSNGEHVEVYGVFVQGTFQARAIKIKDEAGEDPHKIKGPVLSVDATAGTFDVNVRLARGFLPEHQVLRVTTTGSTRFMADSGAQMTKAEFFAALALPGAKVEVQGTASGSTFAAVKAKLENEFDRPQVEIKGPVEAFDADAGTLTLAVQRWFGYGFTQGQSVSVVVDSNTEFRLQSDPLTREAFFAALQLGAVVEAKGSYDGTQLTAKRLKLDD